MLKMSQPCIFSLLPLEVNLHAKLDVSSFNLSRDIEGVPKFQKEVMWHPPIPFDLILHFVRYVPGDQSACKIEVSSSNRSRDMEAIGGGPKIWKVGHVTPLRPVNGVRW